MGRRQCDGFRLAALKKQNYRVAEVYVKDMGSYSEYRLHIEPVHKLAPGEITVHMARAHSVTDLSLFQVTAVEPAPCALYSGMDDAMLMSPGVGEAAVKAKNAAMQVLNKMRNILCPHLPQLQFV